MCYSSQWSQPLWDKDLYHGCSKNLQERLMALFLGGNFKGGNLAVATLVSPRTKDEN